MKIVEIGGALCTTLSNEEYALYRRINKYCKEFKTNIIPHERLSKYQRDNILEKLLDSHLIDIKDGVYILREID